MSRTLRRDWTTRWTLRTSHDEKSCRATDCDGCEKGVWRRLRNKRLRRADRQAVTEQLDPTPTAPNGDHHE